MTPPLASWFLATRSLNSQAAVIAHNTKGLLLYPLVKKKKFSLFKNQDLQAHRMQTCKERMHAAFKQDTGEEERLNYFFFFFFSFSPVLITIYFSFGVIVPYEGL